MIRKIVDSLYSMLLFAADRATVAVSVRKNRAGSVLVVRLDAIGDFILWLDCARHLKQLFPGRKIVLLANSVWAGFAESFPYWDEVWPLDRKRFLKNLAYRARMIRKVRAAGFVTVVHPVFSREFLYGDAIIGTCGAAERIGSAGDHSNMGTFGKRVSDRFYTRLIPASSRQMTELSRNVEFMRGMGIDMKATLPDISAAIVGVENPLSHLSGYYVLFPGAGWAGRQWPPERFSELADAIYRMRGLTAVICGDASDNQTAQKIASMVRGPVVDITGKTDLAQLAVIIRDAIFLIGNETSAVHMAAALSTPSFCILGGGHYGRFLPYDLKEVDDRLLPVPIVHRMECFGCNWHCRYKVKKGRPVPCIEKIEPDQVIDALTTAGNNHD